MNERRLEVINQAFRIMDGNGSGTVEIDDLAISYNADHHPKVSMHACMMMMMMMMTRLFEPP